jgi:hypothetical protein
MMVRPLPTQRRRQPGAGWPSPFPAFGPGAEGTTPPAWDPLRGDQWAKAVPPLWQYFSGVSKSHSSSSAHPKASAPSAVIDFSCKAAPSEGAEEGPSVPIMDPVGAAGHDGAVQSARRSSRRSSCPIKNGETSAEESRQWLVAEMSAN